MDNDDFTSPIFRNKPEYARRALDAAMNVDLQQDQLRSVGEMWERDLIIGEFWPLDHGLKARVLVTKIANGVRTRQVFEK